MRSEILSLLCPVFLVPKKEPGIWMTFRYLLNKGQERELQVTVKSGGRASLCEVPGPGEVTESLIRILQNRDGYRWSVFLYAAHQGLLSCFLWLLGRGWSKVCLSLVAVSAVWWFEREEQKNLSFLVDSFQSNSLSSHTPTQTCPHRSMFSCGSAVVWPVAWVEEARADTRKFMEVGSLEVWGKGTRNRKMMSCS